MEKTKSCHVVSKSGKKIFVTSEEGKFYLPLFKGLVLYLDDEEISDSMTTNEISRKFVWERMQLTPERHKEFVIMLRENSLSNICTCGKKELVDVFYVTHILSSTRCVIGSSCIEHWFESDQEFKKLNQEKYDTELLNFNISKKIIQFDAENISYCKKCFTRNEMKRCSCEIKEERAREIEFNKRNAELRKQEEQEIRKKKREQRRKNCVSFKDITFKLKDRAKKYAREHAIFIDWDEVNKTWYGEKEYAHLFEIYIDGDKELFYFEIDWKECISA
jgi:hypothetical protein